MSDADRLRPEVASALIDPNNEVAASAVSAMEIAIKQSLGKLDLPGPAETWLEEAIREVGFGFADLSCTDALRLQALPWHHRDPFDRLLVAQAMGGWTLCTQDEQMAAYPCSVLGV